MMEYTNEDLGLRFTLPDKPTVRQQLQYKARLFAAGFATEDIYIRHWQALTGLLEEWECNTIPDPLDFDLDSNTDPDAADVVFWAANQGAGWLLSLERVNKKK